MRLGVRTEGLEVSGVLGCSIQSLVLLLAVNPVSVRNGKAFVLKMRCETKWQR